MRRIPWLAVLLLLPSCCAFRCGGHPRRETLAQVSTIDAILAADYDGKRPCRDLLRFGGFGIGTFHALDGEMIVLDGTIYQVPADGKARVMPRTVRTPFACVTSFEPDVTLSAPAETDFAGLTKRIDRSVGAKNLFLAIRVDGAFGHMKTRSVPAQKKPYPPLVEVTKNQPIFEFKDVEGTIVGFRCPPFVKGINVPGYHLHFITEDRTGGGHVLAFTLKSGTIAVDITPNFYLMLPSGGAFQKLDLGADRAKDLHKAEK